MNPDAKHVENGAAPPASQNSKTTSTRIAAAISLLFAVVAAAATAFIYFGMYDVSATSPHYGITYWTMRTVMHRSIKRQARDFTAPELDDPQRVHAGFRNFHAMCVTCHGAPGVEPSEISKGLYPRAPDLAIAAKDWAPAELFVIIKRGIKMSGMPAWEASHSGDQIWEMVAFLRQYPSMPASEYQEAVEYYAKSGQSEPMHH